MTITWLGIYDSLLCYVQISSNLFNSSLLGFLFRNKLSLSPRSLYVLISSWFDSSTLCCLNLNSHFTSFLQLNRSFVLYFQLLASLLELHGQGFPLD